MKIHLNKSQGKLVSDLINKWQEEKFIDDDTSKNLLNSIEVKTVNWKKVALYSFWISIACVLISLSSLVADKFLLNLMEQLFAAPDFAFCIFFSLTSVLIFRWAFMSRERHPKRNFSNDFLVMIAILSTATSIAFLGKSIDTGSGHFSLLFLLATVIYTIIGIRYKSHLVWLSGLLSLGIWFGTETGFASDWQPYYLGMNYPLRFSLFSVILLASHLLLIKKLKFTPYKKDTQITILSYLFISLWTLSIFGNSGDFNKWIDTKQTEFIGWTILLLTASILAIIAGNKYNDRITKSFGICFLLLNIYTRYFEYLWNIMHVSLFFIILAISFWFIGKNAEKIWNINISIRK